MRILTRALTILFGAFINSFLTPALTCTLTQALNSVVVRVFYLQKTLYRTTHVLCRFWCSMLLMFYWDNEEKSSNLAYFSIGHLCQEMKELQIILFESFSCDMPGNGILTPCSKPFMDFNQKCVPNVMEKSNFIYYFLFYLTQILVFYYIEQGLYQYCIYIQKPKCRV